MGIDMSKGKSVTVKLRTERFPLFLVGQQELISLHYSCCCCCQACFVFGSGIHLAEACPCGIGYTTKFTSQP